MGMQFAAPVASSLPFKIPWKFAGVAPNLTSSRGRQIQSSLPPSSFRDEHYDSNTVSWGFRRQYVVPGNAFTNPGKSTGLVDAAGKLNGHNKVFTFSSSGSCKRAPTSSVFQTKHAILGSSSSSKASKSCTANTCSSLGLFFLLCTSTAWPVVPSPAGPEEVAPRPSAVPEEEVLASSPSSHTSIDI